LSHGGSIPAADAHYKAVCRAYVAEALELSTFLQKVSKGKVSFGSENFLGIGTLRDPELDKLEFTDWVRFHNFRILHVRLARALSVESGF